MLAGANGVGKTTFAYANLRPLVDQEAFLNADEIAQDLNPSDVDSTAIEAARRLLRRRRSFLESGDRSVWRPHWRRGLSRNSSMKRRRRHKLGLRYLMGYWQACSAAIVFDAQSLSPREIARKDERGMNISDAAGWALLQECIVAAGAT